MDGNQPSSIFISAHDLWALINADEAVQIFDVRRRPIYEAANGVIPGAIWRDTFQVATWQSELDKSRPVVAACVHGHEMSQSAVTHLRSNGFNALALEGGYDAWIAAGLPLIAKAPSP